MNSPLSRAVTRFDSWWNVLTNVGTTLNRTAFGFVRDARLPDQALEDLYHGDAFAARICDAVPEEALRKGFKVLTGDPMQESTLAARLEELRVREACVEAWTWARVYGGAAILVGADDGRDPVLPLDPSTLRSVRFLTVLDRRELMPQTWVDDPLSRSFGMPETYRLSRNGGAGALDTRLVHGSRVVRFDGTLTGRRRRRENNGWAESELQRVLDKLTQFNGAFAAVGTLLQDASQGVFKIKDLISMMAGDTADALKQRMALMDLSRSVGRAILVDADAEDFERVETTMAGMPDVLDKFLLLLAGAARIPVTILMGQAPAGLNATGDSDIRWFYDRIASAQANVLRPRLDRIVRLAFLAQDGPTGGVEPAKWHVEFPPLWQLSPTEEATRRATVAQTDVAYIQAQVVTPEEVALSRFRPEGWNADMIVDRDVRAALLAADAATPPPEPDPTPPPRPETSPPPPAPPAPPPPSPAAPRAP